MSDRNRAFRSCWCYPARHRIAKVLSDTVTIAAHSRRPIRQRLARELLAAIQDQITRQPAVTALIEGIEVPSTPASLVMMR